MIKLRRLYYEILPYFDHKNAIVITGSRQVGKTSLMRVLFSQVAESQKLWFDLDNPLHQKIFEEIDYDTIYTNLMSRGLDSSKRPYIFIDEIQNFPDITKVMKYLIDHYGVKFFVTGSSSFYMKNLFPESLSGRKFVFNLHPLDFQEFLTFKEKCPESVLKEQNLDLQPKSRIEYETFRAEWDEYLKWGGFPEIALAQSTEEKELILDNIFKSFFEKDILELSHYRDVREIRDTILLLAQRVGSKLDVTRLASELGVRRYKVYDYLEFLQATFIIQLVDMHTKSVDRRVAAGKKVYFLDTGLLQKIAQVNEGQIFENTIYQLLARHGDLAYFQKGSTQEIDFILKTKEKADPIAFEVKVTGTPSDLKQVQRLSKKLELGEFYLISRRFVPELERVVYPQFL